MTRCSGIAVCAVLVLVCCATLSVDAAPRRRSELRDLSTLGWSLRFIEAVYYRDSDTTTFSYEVTVGNTDLSHLMITPGGCARPALLELGSFWDDMTSIPDEAGNTKGYRFSYGQAKNTVRMYNLTLQGSVNIGSVQYMLKGAFLYGVGSTQGPVCQGQSLQVACSAPESPLTPIQCDSALLAEPQPGSNGFVRQIRSEGRCVGEYLITRIYRSPVAGVSNAYTECEQNIQVIDTQGPVLSVSDMTRQLNCTDVVPAAPQVTATDNCDPVINVNYCEERTNGTCPTEYFITRTWTATDECGNSKCVTHTFAVVDLIPPTLHGVPANLELDCTAAIPAMATVTATDNCDCPATVTASESTYPGDCPSSRTIVREWIATDCCGNTARGRQMIRIADITPPTMSVQGTLVNGTFECDNLPAVPTVTASDDCTLNVPVVYNETRHPSTVCPSQYILERMWTACDDCGNCACLTSIIQVVDRTKPVFQNLPSNVTVPCGSVPSPAQVTATDNCGLKSLNMTETTLPTSCPNEYALLRRWLAVDECGNSAEYTQRIDVEDTVPPAFGPLPSVGPFICPEDVPSLNSTLALITFVRGAEPCDFTGALTATEEMRPGVCVNQFVLVRHFTLTDCSGNRATANISITVNDNVAPVLSGVPADVSVDCLNVPAPATVTALDNCDDVVPVSYNEVKTPGRCAGEYVLTRTWTAVDRCGNSASATQRVSVFDNQPPTFVNPPGPIEAPCHLVPEAPIVSATDNCGAVTVNLTLASGTGPCVNAFSITRRWTACDDCGNCAIHTQVVSVSDNTLPELDNVPADINVSCLDIPAPADVCASDNCPGVELSFREDRIDYPQCTPEQWVYTLVRTWTATDACGQSVTATQRVNVYDNIPPTIAQLQDLVQDCSAVVMPEAPLANDSCTAVTVSAQHVRVAGPCEGSYSWLIRFRAVDACGNVAWSNSTLSVRDTTPPAVQGPANASNECVPLAADPLVVTDDCSTYTILPMNETQVSLECPNSYLMRRDWLVTDRCGNVATHSSYFQVTDTTPPTWDQAMPANITVECSPPDVPAISASDNCGPAVVMFEERNETVRCVNSYRLRREWVAMDMCGNELRHVQIIEVVDNTAPTLEGVPASSVSECIAEDPAIVCADDNCPGVTLRFIENKIPGSCPYNFQLNRTWTAEDDCGNKVSRSHLVTVRDTTAPTFLTTPPATQTYECELPALTAPPASDNCGTVTVLPFHSRVNERCPTDFDYLVAWRAMDQCGNVAWFNYTILVRNRVPPQILSWSPAPPTNDTFLCGQEPAAPVPTVIGHCGPATYTRLPDVKTPGPCPARYTLLRQWLVRDECNNTASASQLLTGIFEQGPVILSPPANISVSCDDLPVPQPTLQGRDACGNLLPVTMTERRIDGPCPDNYTLERTFVTVDACGLTATHVQLISVYDNEAPAPNEPSDILAPNVCAPLNFGSVAATDNCDPNPAITIADQFSPGSCPYIHNDTRFWTARDRCGNQVQVYQTIRYTFNLLPRLENLPASHITDIPCDSTVDLAPVTGFDACNNSLIPTFTTRIENGSCPQAWSEYRTWTVQDICGGVASFTQRLDYVDRTPPTLINVPASRTAQCGFLPPIPDNVTAIDNCSPSVTITVTVRRHPGASCCDFVEERIFVAVDECNNTAQAVQNITVFEHTPPIVVAPPPILCFPCENLTSGVIDSNSSGETDAYVLLPEPLQGYCVAESIAADECSPVAAPHAGEVQIRIAGSLRTLRYESMSLIINMDGRAKVWGKLVDTQSSAEYDLSVTLNGRKEFADLPSGYTIAKTLKSACYDRGLNDPRLVDFSDWTFYNVFENAALTGPGGVNIALSPASASLSQFGLGANGFTKTYGATIFLSYQSGGSTYSASLPLGLIANGVDGCSFDASQFPEFQCNDTQVPPNIEIFDTITNGSCPQNYTIIRQFCVTDNVTGEQFCAPQIITVCDINPPVIQTPGDSTLDCKQPVPPINVNVSDECDELANYTYTETRIDGVCPASYTLVRNITASDACGNLAFASYRITFRDTTAPVLVGLPANRINASCDNVPAPVVVRATDDCSEVTVSGPVEERTPGPCPNSYLLTRTYTAVDACGNRVTGEYDVMVTDTTRPVIATPPADVTLECLAAMPTAIPTASDNCSPNVTVSVSTTPLTGNSCPNLGTRTRSFTARDACGNNALPKIQRVTYVDTLPPTFNQPLPQNATVQCDAVPAAAQLTASDACGPATVSFEEFVNRTPNDCRYTIIRKWVARDCSGNTATHVQALLVVDTQLPTLTEVPAVVDANCTHIPAPPAVCVSDNCPNTRLRFVETKQQLDNNPACPKYNLLRVWTAIDNCGNNASVSQTVRVADTVAPVCTGLAAPRNVSCEDEASATPAAPSCSDDCTEVTLTPFHSVSPGSCAPQKIKYYNWRACDACGNCAWYNTTVSVYDITPPVLSNLPSYQPLECLAAVPAHNVRATDLCGGNRPVSVVRTNISHSCPNLGPFDLVFSAQDECGNRVESAPIRVIYQDTLPPRWTSTLPSNMTVQCDNIPAPATLTAADDCSQASVSFLESNSTVNECEQRITRRWTATDCSGNSITHVQVLTVRDDTPPTLSGDFSDVFGTCQNIPAPADVCGADNCPGVRLSFSETRSQANPACPLFSLNRTWVLTDRCGNRDVRTQIVRVSDNTPPTCQLPPHPANISCELEGSLVVSPPVCSDDCTTVSLTPYERTAPGPCPTSHIRHFAWLASDLCGNTRWINTSVLVYDKTAPQFVNPPADIEVPCDNVPQPPTVSATDNCGQVTVSYSEVNTRLPNACQNYTIVRTWTAQDECGNQAVHRQNVRVIDVYPITWNGQLPVNLTIECDTTVLPGPMTASSPCHNVSVEFRGTNLPNEGCQRLTQWQWIATDICGNRLVHTVYLRVVDTQKPEISDVVPVLTENCPYESSPPEVCCSDNCPDVVLSFREDIIPGPCASVYQINRTWTCTDACGNVDVANQLVHVVDNNQPAFNRSFAPNLFFECELGELEHGVSADNACVDVTLTETNQTIPGGCPANYTIIRRWSGVDECGKQINMTQTVDVRDTKPPVSNDTLLCFISNSYRDHMVIPNATVPNNLFPAFDECSAVEIRLLSCTSNQDAKMGATATIPGFTTHCNYFAANDTLILSGVIDTTDAMGRLYTIQAEIRDACGHTTYAKADIFVPLNHTSIDLRDYPISFEECVPFQITCPDECPCQTLNHYCVVTPNAFPGYALSLNKKQTVGGNTLFSYALSQGVGAHPNRVVLGLDLSKYEVVSASPAGWRVGTVSAGTPAGSFISGIYWDNDNSLSYEFTLRGIVNGNGQLPVQLGGYQAEADDLPSACAEVAYIEGPSGSATYDASSQNDYAGSVIVEGVRFGNSRSLNLPLADVLVALVDKTSKVAVQYSKTNSNGHYSFHDVSSPSNYEIQLVKSSLLDYNLKRTSGRFLRVGQYSQLHGDLQLGLPHSLSDLTFRLLIDDQIVPYYNRPNVAPAFEGNSKPLSYWQYQSIANELPNMSQLNAAADALIGCSTSFSSSLTDDLKNNLRAAALNIASGRGFFEPYNLVHTWYLKFAAHVQCSNSNNAEDLALALRFARAINNAADI